MVEFDLVRIAVWGTTIALFFMVMRWLAGFLQLQGGALENVGKGIKNVYP